MSDLFAALDLGSNSFHLLLARRDGTTFETVERLKEKVRLLSGFSNGRLDGAAMRRGEACLARFAQRLADLPRTNLRMAGTHALREARNREEFVAVAERSMGAALELVSGGEEARLIYLGVAHHAPCSSGEQRLVLDVGGGSTELAFSAGSDCAGEPGRATSFKVGCVSLTERYFTRGMAEDQAYRAAREHALKVFGELEPVEPDYAVIGTSGTIESVQTVLAANGWGSDDITPEGLRSLTEAIVSRRWLVEAGLPGLDPDRVDIFPAGVALVDALFEVLGIQAMRYVDASLQDGLLYRELGPLGPETDLRAHTVLRLKRRYGVDEAQAARVRRAALTLFDGSRAWWPEPERWRSLLGWAAELHQVGMSVAPEHYHRHGAYLLQNSDLRVFSRAEQSQLTLLVRGHRRSFPALALRTYEADARIQLQRLLALLRIAVIVHRSHSDAHTPALGVTVADATLRLHLPDGWLAAHPLSSRELEVEVEQLATAGVRLEYR